MSTPWRGVVLGLVLALAMTSCIVHRLTGPRMTGTCDGACAHYIECKPDHPDKDRARCQTECPDAFSDSDSLMAYESLECKDAVEYVDGISPTAAASR